MSLRVKIIVFLQDFEQTVTGQSAVNAIIEQDSAEVMHESFMVYATQAMLGALRCMNSVAMVETEKGIHQTKPVCKGPEGEQ